MAPIKAANIEPIIRRYVGISMVSSIINPPEAAGGLPVEIDEAYASNGMDKVRSKTLAVVSKNGLNFSTLTSLL